MDSMINPAKLETTFQNYMSDLDRHTPDGVMDVDLQLLQSLDLLHDWDEAGESETLTSHFHVIETQEKLTLFNEQFAAWIVPYSIESEPVTMTLVSVINGDNPRLEVAYLTSGVYNTSRTVLKVLERLIHEIRETETVIARLSETG